MDRDREEGKAAPARTSPNLGAILANLLAIGVQ
jgi:hypothetical protein